MDSITIIGIVIFAAIIIPIWLLIRAQSAGKRKLQKEITPLSKGIKIEITEHESFKNKVLGIDRENNKGAYAILNPPHNQAFVADLNQYSRCYVDKQQPNPAVKTEAIDKINLQFIAKEKGALNLVFPIYDNSIDPALTNELTIAEEWADKFNGMIHKSSV